MLPRASSVMAIAWFRGYLWDILRNTIDKTVVRTEVMRKELKAVQPDQQPAPAEASGASTTATAVDDVRLQQARESYQTALRDQNDLLLLVFQVRRRRPTRWWWLMLLWLSLPMGSC